MQPPTKFDVKYDSVLAQAPKGHEAEFFIKKLGEDPEFRKVVATALASYRTTTADGQMIAGPSKAQWLRDQIIDEYFQKLSF